MNDEASTQLKIMVERVVRPLVTILARKRQLREELLAHVTEVYETELAHSGDEAKALAATRGRFGDPRELAAQLQSGVSRRERWGVWIEKYSWQPGESATRGAAKTALVMAASLVAALLAVLIVAMFSRRAIPLAAATQLFLTLAVVMSAWTFGFIVFVERLASWCFSAPSERRRALGALWLVVSLTFLPALAFSVFWGATGDLPGSLRHARFACLFAPLAPALLLLVARDLSWQLRHHREWNALVIEE